MTLFFSVKIWTIRVVWQFQSQNDTKLKAVVFSRLGFCEPKIKSIFEYSRLVLFKTTKGEQKMKPKDLASIFINKQMLFLRKT